jgi:hypothetical protein
MRLPPPLFRSAGLAALLLASAGAARAAPDGTALVGTWVVDLRPTPDAPPYLQEFVVAAVDGRSFSGRFYGTPVTDARLNPDWGALRIAFVTGDGSGAYHHAAVLNGNRLEGQSLSTGRGFLAVWTATRKPAP